MSLWLNSLRNTRLQELLGAPPRVIIGEVDDERPVDERSLVLLVAEAVEVTEDTEDGDDRVLEIVLGSLVALVVDGTIVFVSLSRYFPNQMRRVEAFSVDAARAVVQVKLAFVVILMYISFIVFGWSFSFLGFLLILRISGDELLPEGSER